MIANLATATKGGLVLLALAVLTLAVMTVNGWHNGYVAHAALQPKYDEMTKERDGLVDSVLGLSIENGALKLAIAHQNSALALAEEKTRSIEAQQAQARQRSADLEKQKERRIRELEAQLRDPKTTVTELLDSHWRRHAN